ncbi:CDP-diacylglycerol--inositol 3-phosphatidyltransferase-like [Paramacrobiotus metropolitanus]|uniref:CDP-diacylglycerol--inositol 3-phosphatidyltransferase-like n=1 Tax=Paramacrobiotus metropolitanus TaxID=2943436 RepID=UPI002445C1AA|nr:CDP-diacylglycerol--inositol 3-phosphatidyltransferase-like [Paramacrobiotus metropolitanus]XP_055338658.1 CDP-diacylglycerol--inositol 3-phosphatidyltransferase-like [Paramacrobiotus metropolitanus]XP_055338659.1 CDP-diacylglycerol--inositol 3-phosphatidyltransferase-like [Paramacrobiotus metropolitanus]XP_055338660.1 CDP-diacylglycerol--inositol 3-phosphatidyltransferase-like [Paramacrobiotus metropolitanus]
MATPTYVRDLKDMPGNAHNPFLIPGAKEAPRDIFLFVPNLIGYFRVIAALISFYYMPFSPYLAFWWYMASALADALDGYAARYLKQTSRVGALLDMLTDRCATNCLIMVLGHFYPKWMVLFQSIVALDITSHWIHMYSAMLKGTVSHKIIDLAAHPLLRIYYSSRTVLFWMCAGNEVFYAALYMLHFTSGPGIFFGWGPGLFTTLAILCTPVAVVKAGISVIQLIAAMRNVASFDVEERAEVARTDREKSKP